jgi:GxxExxY protein
MSLVKSAILARYCGMTLDTAKTENELSRLILSASIEVHRQLGPGLLEKAYGTCLAHELAQRRVRFAKEVPIPLIYKGTKLDCGFRADMIIEVLVEVKAVAALVEIHKAQAITYLKLTRLRLCLLLNFNTTLMRDGTMRVVLGL